jgi:hypothetical protein
VCSCCPFLSGCALSDVRGRQGAFSLVALRNYGESTSRRQGGSGRLDETPSTELYPNRDTGLSTTLFFLFERQGYCKPASRTIASPDPRLYRRWLTRDAALANSIIPTDARRPRGRFRRTAGVRLAATFQDRAPRRLLCVGCGRSAVRGNYGFPADLYRSRAMQEGSCPVQTCGARGIKMIGWITRVLAAKSL